MANWKITGYEENDDSFFIRARYNFEPSICSHCEPTNGFLYRHGKTQKTVKDVPARGKNVVIELEIQRYRCKNCRLSFTQTVDQIADKNNLTKRLVSYIERKCIDETFAWISRDTGVDENTISSILTEFMENNEASMTFPTPEVLGIDGVYIKKKDRCIMTDLKNKRVIGLHRRADGYNVAQYLLEFKNKENIKFVVMDMSITFRSAVREILGDQVKIIIDKYHIQRMGKTAIDNLLRKFRERFNTTKQREFLRDRHLLYSRSYNLKNEKRKALQKWASKFPIIAEIYNLKEEFMNIWQYKSKKKAERAFITWKNKIPSYLTFAFKAALTAFKEWYEEIFNYFDCFFTNAYTESANNLVKTIQKDTRGCSFWVARAKILMRFYFKLKEDEKRPPAETNNYSFSKPKKHQRVLRLKQSQEHSSEVFAILFPKEVSWKERFEPYLHLLHKD